MDKGPVQKLLLKDEYKEMIKENVVVEGQFVEMDGKGDAVDVVWLALSRNYLFMVRRLFPNFDDFDVRRMCKCTSDDNLDVEGLELKTIMPIDYIKISAMDHEYILKITTAALKIRYFQLCTTEGRDKVWNKWLVRAAYLSGDTYGSSSLLPIRGRGEFSPTTSMRLLSAYQKDIFEKDESSLFLNADSSSICSWTNAVEPVS